jgi:hypothetical protein
MKINFGAKPKQATSCLCAFRGNAESPNQATALRRGLIGPEVADSKTKERVLHNASRHSLIIFIHPFTHPSVQSVQKS